MLAADCRVLLTIEDSDEDFAAFKWVMKKLSLSYPVFRCADGDDAFDFLYGNGKYADRSRFPQPSVICLDLNLPGTDGREILSQIKQDETLQKIPVVIFTTSDNPRDIELCYQYGASGYIVKPIHLNHLVESLNSFFKYWFETVVFPTPH
ncbi:MAG: response regulator [Geitlerinemataceae cyanobacterium]